ncbi:MAG: DUF4411 family protein [Firmicutes bacterium]|nr:DUF4411 family protein [Bacillota bacterium]
MNRPYLLDANVFIEAARRYYAFDLVPAFWQALLDHATAGRVCSIDRVRDELIKGNDDFAAWVSGEFHNWFASTDEVSVIEAYKQIMQWVYEHGQFSDTAKAAFASGADGWLVAYARVHGHEVVTHEQLNHETKRKVPIPNVCDAFHVPYIDTFGMLRSLGIRFG